jgi:hypothetical protein
MTCRNAFAVLVLMLAACGGAVQSEADGSGGATGGGASGTGAASGAGASAGIGGSAAYGGSSGTGAATGGAAGMGGATSVVCADGAGTHLASAARACTVDGDCTVLYGNTCTQSAYGIANAAVAAYGGCFWTDLRKCAVDCIPSNWYRTDTGAMTPTVARGIDAKQLVEVHCTAGLCTTSVLPMDAGADAAGDGANPQCGSGSCRAMLWSFCDDPNAYAMTSWQCTMDNGFQGYCCLPRSDCGASSFCASAGDCRYPMLLTQRGCGLEGGPGSCCVEPK